MRQASKPGLLKKPAAKLKAKRIYTPEEGRAAYLRFMEKASKLPGAEAAYRRIADCGSMLVFQIGAEGQARRASLETRSRRGQSKGRLA